MDAADPLRPEEGPEKPKGGESQDDGYETSNSGEARRADPEPAPPPPDPPAPPPPLPPPQQPPPQQPAPVPSHDQYEPLMRHYASPYRQFEQEPEPYQHFPFPKYSNDPYSFKREPDAPYDMSQHHPHEHHQHQHQHQYQKRDDDMYNGIKRECEDPYSFVEEEAMSMMLGAQHSGLHAPHEHAQMMHQQMMLNQPKKRGRKKKIKDENGMEIKAEPGMEGAVARPVKERKKHDRFNGMSEEEVARRTLPDHLAENLDIIIVGINPGLFAAYKGHHYAGPGNHFWKCLYLSGLTREQMSADEDYKLLNFGIGFTNMVPRPTKGSADLTRREIKEGSAVLLEKLQTFRPKVAVFNGKLIYEVFSGKKDFCFGKQPDTVAGTNTYMWVMPSSSARCAQLPRAADKVPFYAALKKFRDYLNGLVAHVDEAELVFPDNTTRRPHEEMEIRRSNTGRQLTMEPEPGDTIILEDGTEVPLKKKRGRPKKVKLENGEVVPPTPRAPRAPRPPPALGPNGEEPPKKKRGRPKKIRPEEQQFLLQQQQQQQQQTVQAAQVTPPQPPTPQAPPQQNNPMLQPQPQLPMAGLPHEQQYMSPGMQFDQQMYMQDHDNYYHHDNAGNTTMESGTSMDMGMSLQRGYSSPGAAGGGGGGGGGAGAGAGYASSPRAVYHSPRSQGYSPGPPRHQPTPQPQFPGSPAGGYGGGAGGAGRLGGGLAARSPLYAASPAPYPHPQPSPAPPPAHPAHPAHSAPLAQRFAPSPQYSRSPAPAQPQRPYSRSPAPAAGSAGAGSFSAASPGGALHSYTPSPQHTPYSQHSSPAPSTAQPTPTYVNDGHYTQGGSTGSGSAGSGSYAAELSSDMGAATSPPPAASPLAVDFEPPRDSPLGSTDMHPGSNSNSSLNDYNKTNSQAGSEMSPVGVGSGVVGGGNQFGSGLYEGERLPYRLHSPAAMDKEHYHYSQEQGSSGVDSPRLDQMHQHPAMYPTNYNRSTPDGGGDGQSFRPPEQPHTPHHPGSPASYGETVKTKSQDVASKSLSGLESLVDQIPSIAEGPGAGVSGVSGVSGIQVGSVGVPTSEQPAPAPVPSLPEYAPALYGPYSAYGGAAYGNNGYGGPFVGYGGGWGGVMRPTPGYLSEWQYPYTGVAGVAGVAGVPPSYAPYNSPYYNGYTPPPAHAQQAHYLSAPPLLELHKNGEHGQPVSAVPSVPSVPSVGFGGFC